MLYEVITIAFDKGRFDAGVNQVDDLIRGLDMGPHRHDPARLSYNFV